MYIETSVKLLGRQPMEIPELQPDHRRTANFLRSIGSRAAGVCATAPISRLHLPEGTGITRNEIASLKPRKAALDLPARIRGEGENACAATVHIHLVTLGFEPGSAPRPGQKWALE